MPGHAITRRRLLGVSAAAGLGAVLERAPGVGAAIGRREVDVAVVGAGFAGLTAARKLVKAGRSGVVPPDPQVIGDAVAVVAQLDQMSTEVPVNAPWKASSAGEWDGESLESWVRDNSSYDTNSRFRRLVATATRPIFGAEARDLSLLFTLFYIAASG